MFLLTHLHIYFSEFADVLEQLESAFYFQALAQFQASDFTSAGFPSSQLVIEQLTVIQSDEATHSSVLQVIQFTINPTITYSLFRLPYSHSVRHLSQIVNSTSQVH